MNDYEKNFGEDKSAIQRFLEIVSFIMVVGMIVYTLWLWQVLPDQIATHFNAAGEVDGYGSKWTLWLMNGLMVLMYGAMFLTPKMKKLYNYPVKITENNKEIQFELISVFTRVIIFESIVLIAFIQWGTINNALGKNEMLNSIVLFALLGLMVVTTAIYITISIRNR